MISLFFYPSKDDDLTNKHVTLRGFNHQKMGYNGKTYDGHYGV
jgi:hypothetical protein